MRDVLQWVGIALLMALYVSLAVALLAGSHHGHPIRLGDELRHKYRPDEFSRGE